MSKAVKMQKRTGIILTLLIVVISFFPIVYLDEGSSTVVELLRGLKGDASAPYMILCVISLLIPLLYAVCLVIDLAGKEVSWFSSTASYISFIAILVIGIAVLILTINTNAEIMFPVTKWVVIRWILSLIEYVNKRSGEEFFQTMLKE